MKLVLLSLCFWLSCVLQISADLNDSCGQREDSSWKWHVQLLNIQLTEQDLNCGGTLLNKLFVTTTAHCLYNLNGDQLDIGQLRIIFPDGEYRSIRRTFQPKPFDIENISNDFVLLLLDREVSYNYLVAPICLPKVYEIQVQDVHTPVLTSGSLSVNREDTCLNDTNILFGMVYMDAICLGTFDRSHKYHRNAGSGIFAKRSSKWYLVGLVMYTTGPTKIRITYIGGIHLQRYLTWIKRTMDHYSQAPSIIEKSSNCSFR
ncbi:serine protease 52-like [Ochlerotatus camptorhynchus]|uniref:serine protease 52-like n=1 Tax=Ochlerotatus camptorhynchus TaxID=644619 RepID=UPI0031D6882F